MASQVCLMWNAGRAKQRMSAWHGTYIVTWQAKCAWCGMLGERSSECLPDMELILSHGKPSVLDVKCWASEAANFCLTWNLYRHMASQVCLIWNAGRAKQRMSAWHGTYIVTWQAKCAWCEMLGERSSELLPDMELILSHGKPSVLDMECWESEAANFCLTWNLYCHMASQVCLIWNAGRAKQRMSAWHGTYIITWQRLGPGHEVFIFSECKIQGSTVSLKCTRHEGEVSTNINHCNILHKWCSVL